MSNSDAENTTDSEEEGDRYRGSSQTAIYTKPSERDLERAVARLETE